MVSRDYGSLTRKITGPEYYEESEIIYLGENKR
jgi:hypothetical protein